jgi:hypothetical protein
LAFGSQAGSPPQSERRTGAWGDWAARDEPARETWIDAESDRDKRIIAFAKTLREDALKGFVPGTEKRSDAHNAQSQELLYEGLMGVDWLRVAAGPIDRFTPGRLAGYVSTPSVNCVALLQGGLG